MPSGYPGTTGGHGTVARYHTCHCQPCRDANTRQYHLRMLDPVRKVDSTPTARKIQALMSIGWSGPLIAERLSVGRARLQHLCRQMHPNVRREVADRVDAVYRDLHMKSPPLRTPRERAAAARAQKVAREKGWPPPLAWDNIDDLTETPDPATYHQEAS